MCPASCAGVSPRLLAPRLLARVFLLRKKRSTLIVRGFLVCPAFPGRREVLLSEANLQVGSRDVIQSGGRGYRLADKISVRSANEPQNESIREPDHATGDPVVKQGSLNHRQQWILHKICDGVSLRLSDVVARFGCSKSTAKRDLAGLGRRGLATFVGPPRTGLWKR